jgi:hypothetical protein
MNNMSIPGFTAEMSLYNTNKLGGHYGMMSIDTSTSSRLVIGQQLLGGIIPLPRQSLELECPPCVRGNSVSCSVVSVNYLTSPSTRTYLGRVVLPRTCWDPCIN